MFAIERKRPTLFSRLFLLMAGLVLLSGSSLVRFKTICHDGLDFSVNHRRNSIDASSQPTTELAFRESFGFFDDMKDAHWKLYQERYRSELIFMQPMTPEPKSDVQTALWMFNNVDPMFTCPHSRRVGGRGDGPKWVCDPHRLRRLDDCLVYSIGSAGNFMFEDALVDLVKSNHCEIHVFDPNPDYARPNDVTLKNIHYHAWGLKSSYSVLEANQKGFLTLAEIQQRLGHVGRRLDIFKIDCEGCEWTSYKDWIDDTFDIRQILIEVHAANGRPENVRLSQFFRAFVDHGFVPFAKEANTRPAAKPSGTMFEYSFVKLAPSFFKEEKPVPDISVREAAVNISERRLSV